MHLPLASSGLTFSHETESVRHFGATMKRKIAEQFAQFIFDSILNAGGQHSTAHYCAAAWWTAIERGDFGRHPIVERTHPNEGQNTGEAKP